MNYLNIFLFLLLCLSCSTTNKTTGFKKTYHYEGEKAYLTLKGKVDVIYADSVFSFSYKDGLNFYSLIYSKIFRSGRKNSERTFENL